MASLDACREQAGPFGCVLRMQKGSVLIALSGVNRILLMIYTASLLMPAAHFMWSWILFARSNGSIRQNNSDTDARSITTRALL